LTKLETKNNGTIFLSFPQKKTMQFIFYSAFQTSFLCKPKSSPIFVSEKTVRIVDGLQICLY